MQNEWGVPDWLDASAYPQPTGRARMLVWTWEFLRRNPDYRRFWTEKAARHLHLDALGVRFVDDDAGPVMREAEDRFAIKLFPLDPTSSSLPKFSATFIRQIWRNSDGFPTNIALKTNETGYIFDLTSPLEGQFTALSTMRRKFKRDASNKENSNFENQKNVVTNM